MEIDIEIDDEQMDDNMDDFEQQEGAAGLGMILKSMLRFTKTRRFLGRQTNFPK